MNKSLTAYFKQAKLLVDPFLFELYEASITTKYAIPTSTTNGRKNAINFWQFDALIELHANDFCIFHIIKETKVE